MSAITNEVRATETNDGYDVLEKLVLDRLSRATGPVFRTDAAMLWEAFLGNLPHNHQHYNCRCCRAFVERFGGLVTITETGAQVPAVWPSLETPEFFTNSVVALLNLVARAKVTGVFVSSDKVLGTPKSPKGWTHLCATNPAPWSSLAKTAEQREAELLEDRRILNSSVWDFSEETIETALRVLESERFPGQEKGVGIARWLISLRKSLNGVKNRRTRENLLWLAVATAPAGFCHVKNTVVGTLLDDVAAGKSFEECRRAWSAKVHPLTYQRAQVAPREGQIEAAEKLVAKLGIADSLKRRYARLDELRHVIWTPTVAKEETTGGVFGHLRAKATKTKAMIVPESRITWAKFARDVLVTARRIEVKVPWHGTFVGVTTAEAEGSPPIHQWDLAEFRNPTAHYFYHNGSTATNWGLTAGWTEVAAIAKAPHGNDLPNHARFLRFLNFVIEKAHDSNQERAGCGIFAETLKTELREIRAVIEAYSNRGGISGTGSANGLAFNEQSPVTVRVNGNASYTIDRWE